MTTHLLDLGTGDVHVDGPARVGRPKGNTMAKTSTKAPKPLPDRPAKKGKRRLHVRADLADGGSLHVSHHAMSDRTVRLDGVAVTLGDDAAKPVWIQLAKPGTFRGHPAGPFTMTGETFHEIVRNFKSTENRRVPIDYEHASEADPTEGAIPVAGAPAQGWIVDMRVGDDGNLWGLVEWGAQAREQIRSGQYRYFSPAIRFGAKDRVTGQSIGARMTSGALTNNPFLDGMKPLAAKDAAQKGRAEQVLHAMRGNLAHSPHEYMPAIKAALRMPDLCSARECSEMLGNLRDHLDAVGGNHESSHEGIRLGDYLKPLRDLTGAVPGTTWEQVFDVVEDLIDAAMDQHVIEDHGGDADGAEMTDDDDVDMTDVAPEETRTMGTSNEPTITMTEHQAKVADLSLQLKDATSRADEAEKELKTLRDWQTARLAKDRDARVSRAIEDYPAKFSEDDRELLTTHLTSNPEAFEKKYPALTLADRDRMRRVLSPRGPHAVPTPNSPEAQQVSIVSLADKLQADDAKLSREDALIKAEKQLRLGGRAA